MWGEINCKAGQASRLARTYFLLASSLESNNFKNCWRGKHDDLWPCDACTIIIKPTYTTRIMNIEVAERAWKGEEKGKRERKGGEKKRGDISPGIEPKTLRMEGQNSNHWSPQALACTTPTYIANLDCHELRVASLAALAPPTKSWFLDFQEEEGSEKAKWNSRYGAASSVTKPSNSQRSELLSA